MYAKVFILILLLKVTSSLNIYRCDSIIENEKQFIIQSEPKNCKFVLKSDCETKYHLQFLEFELDNSVSCSGGRLVVQNQEILCGTNTGFKEYKTENNTLVLHYITSQFSKGFKIIVTRQPCLALIQNNCCAESYNLRRFYLSSPNFPESSQNDCVFKIKRANPNICRLRLHFIFYSNGFFNNDCQNGYFEIDSKKICGCHTGLNLISKFDKNWENTPKIIKYVSYGQRDYFYKGFILEVIQDECPDKYVPEGQLRDHLYYFNDQLNRQNINESFVDKMADFIADGTTDYTTEETTTEYLNYLVENKTDMDNNLIIDLNQQKSVVTTTPLFSYYYYRAPDDYDYIPKEREQRNYFDTFEDQIPNFGDDWKCRNFGSNDFKAITERYLWKQMPKCNLNPPIKRDNRCCNIDLVRGYVVSPGYPYYYPPNLNMCYR